MDWQRIAQGITVASAVGLSCLASGAYAQTDSLKALKRAYSEALTLERRDNHFAAAEKFFNIYTAGGRLEQAALAHLTVNLLAAGLPNSSSYFFIKTLQGENRSAIRMVLRYLPQMIDTVGGDLLRKYVLRHTNASDYTRQVRNHFYYFLGKDHLLKGNPDAALSALNQVSSGSGILAPAMYLKGTAQSMLGQLDSAIESFKRCRKWAGDTEPQSRALRKEPEDLEARCIAGLARVYYEKGDFQIADDTYDEISKKSFVWTDILFEQAWNAYAQSDYNRALGKLVTYRSPSLNFVFNPEVDVLRAQSFLALCLYNDVDKTVSEFNKNYGNVGSVLKNFLVRNDRRLGAFFVLAKKTYSRSLHTSDPLQKALNRFIRGPYFTEMLVQERQIRREMVRLRYLARQQPKAKSFGEFLEKISKWRLRSVYLLGGLFVKNSLYDIYKDLLVQLDRMSFIKLEMLKQAKTKLERQLLNKEGDEDRSRGSASVDRKDHQYLWTFNGEYWIDELGDYVFALESECGV